MGPIKRIFNCCWSRDTQEERRLLLNQRSDPYSVITTSAFQEAGISNLSDSIKTHNTHKLVFLNASVAFDFIKKYYLQKLNSTKDYLTKEQQASLEDHSTEIENFRINFKFKDKKIEMVFYPIYSKWKESFGHSQSGDVSFVIRTDNNDFFFCFDAPSKLSKNLVGSDLIILKSTFDPNYNSTKLSEYIDHLPHDTALAIHAKIIFILEFLSDKLNIHTNSPFINILHRNPHTWIISDKQIQKFKIFIKGDCNALLIYRGKIVYLSAGEVKGINPMLHIEKFNNFYKKNKFKLTNKHIEELIKISQAYSESFKKVSSIAGGNEYPIEIPFELDNNLVQIYLCSDGITDNPILQSFLFNIDNTEQVLLIFTKYQTNHNLEILKNLFNKNDLTWKNLDMLTLKRLLIKTIYTENIQNKIKNKTIDEEDYLNIIEEYQNFINDNEDLLNIFKFQHINNNFIIEGQWLFKKDDVAFPIKVKSKAA